MLEYNIPFSKKSIVSQNKVQFFSSMKLLLYIYIFFKHEIIIYIYIIDSWQPEKPV